MVLLLADQIVTTCSMISGLTGLRRRLVYSLFSGLTIWHICILLIRILKPALDYNAPMLTLAAMNVVSNSQDPYYTKLKAGEYLKHKPSGHPCDSAFHCAQKLSKGAKIAIGLIVTVVGLINIGLAMTIVRRIHWYSKV